MSETPTEAQAAPAELVEIPIRLKSRVRPIETTSKTDREWVIGTTSSAEADAYDRTGFLHPAVRGIIIQEFNRVTYGFVVGIYMYGRDPIKCCICRQEAFTTSAENPLVNINQVSAFHGYVAQETRPDGSTSRSLVIEQSCMITCMSTHCREQARAKAEAWEKCQGKLAKCTRCMRVPDMEEPFLRACSRCHKTSYCSVACQRADWTRHKGECTPPT